MELTFSRQNLKSFDKHLKESLVIEWDKILEEKRVLHTHIVTRKHAIAAYTIFNL